MTPDRLRTCLDLIGWSQRQLAGILAIQFSSVQRWANGQTAIPPQVAEWLERVAATHEQNPLPEGWRD